MKEEEEKRSENVYNLNCVEPCHGMKMKNSFEDNKPRVEPSQHEELKNETFFLYFLSCPLVFSRIIIFAPAILSCISFLMWKVRLVLGSRLLLLYARECHKK